MSVRTVDIASIDEHVMLLDLSGDLIRHIGRNAVAPNVVKIYRSAFQAIRRWEPEFDPIEVQLLYLDGVGGLGLGVKGDYLPEGRFGNRTIRQRKGAAFALQAAELTGRAA